MVEFSTDRVQAVRINGSKAKSYTPTDLQKIVQTYGKQLHLNFTVVHGNVGMETVNQLLSEVSIRSLTIISYDLVDRDFN